MKQLLFIASLSVAVIGSPAQEYDLSSPDGSLSAKIFIGAKASLELFKGTEKLLTLENMDLVSADEHLKGMRVVKTTTRSASNTIIPPIKEKSAAYLDTFEELTIGFASDKALTFRLYNEGLAYRFSTSAKDSLTIHKENLAMQFHEGDSIRYQASTSFNSSYETPYEHHGFSDVEPGRL